MRKCAFIGIAVIALLAVSCASGGAAASYYESNAGDFSTETLSNGIPVVFKQNGSGRLCVLRMVIDGGATLVPPEKSGLEDVTLEMLQYGSERYSYAEIQRLRYEQSFSISASAGYDYSVYGFRCIETYADGVLDIFADSVLNPLLGEEDFAKVMAEYAEGVQRTMTDPSGLLGVTTRAAAFAGHPYASQPTPTQDSLRAITLDDVRLHYQTLLDARRLSFVVVGDLSAGRRKAIAERLEAAFGAIPAGDYERPDVPALAVRGATVYKRLEQAGDSGYAFGYYACPDRADSAAYVPYALASMFIEDALFAQVREKYGAVYSAGTGIIGGRRLFGVISVYRASKPDDLLRHIYEAIDAFPDEEGVAQRLDQYKNKYITTVFSTAQDTAGVAGNVVSSLQQYGDPTAYLRRTEQIQAVTPAQVLAAYQTYFARSPDRATGGTPNPIRWVVVDKDGRYRFD